MEKTADAVQAAVKDSMMNWQEATAMPAFIGDLVEKWNAFKEDFEGTEKCPKSCMSEDPPDTCKEPCACSKFAPKLLKSFADSCEKLKIDEDREACKDTLTKAAGAAVREAKKCGKPQKLFSMLPVNVGSTASSIPIAVAAVATLFFVVLAMVALRRRSRGAAVARDALMEEEEMSAED